MTDTSHWLVRVGRIINAISMEAITAAEIVRARSENNCPASSGRNTTGRKIATVVAVDATRAPRTCCAPSKAVSTRLPPASRKRTIFSSTTMEASSTMPTENAIPASEITFIVLALISSTLKANSNDTGMAKATSKVARKRRRNHHNTHTASTIPSSRLPNSICSERLI